jgi:Fe-S cluster biosynthesis and repair protein YggX
MFTIALWIVAKTLKQKVEESKLAHILKWNTMLSSKRGHVQQCTKEKRELQNNMISFLFKMYSYQSLEGYVPKCPLDFSFSSALFQFFCQSTINY